MATSTPAAGTAPSGSSASKLLLGLIAGIVLVAAAGGAAWFFLGRHAEPVEAAAPVPEKPIFVNIEPITVNLQSEGRARFLHLGMTLKVRDEKSRAQIAEFMPVLRSRALLLLSNRKGEDLMTTDDKSRLADEIRTELNRPLAENLPQQGITGIAFTTFVVQ
ncbi:flagellar basal body-associated protein FliL [Variovorax sp.]|uniref:flagellar basal body-associated protein FliL n=1 Tax=Variovorax sp. TaxID=1871043 RepID=UPI002D34674A|nr:flagellar basal body-associated protein FliL [Variovorax sp.]HYP83209.1 flagellar basal body-associated protein FliL [Variovorax sp.]